MAKISGWKLIVTEIVLFNKKSFFLPDHWSVLEDEHTSETAREVASDAIHRRVQKCLVLPIFANFCNDRIFICNRKIHCFGKTMIFFPLAIQRVHDEWF